MEMYRRIGISFGYNGNRWSKFYQMNMSVLKDNMKYYDVSPHPKCSVENQTLEYHENNEKQSSNQSHFTARSHIRSLEDNKSKSIYK